MCNPLFARQHDARFSLADGCKCAPVDKGDAFSAINRTRPVRKGVIFPRVAKIGMCIDVYFLTDSYPFFSPYLLNVA